MIQKIFIMIIRLYQISISPMIGKNCRFYPTCSEYGIMAIKKFGVVRGIFLIVKRILKCHPFHKGGIDIP